MLAALRNRPRYYTDEDATAWLDERLRMDGALCAARSGLRNWPEADGEKLALSPGRWQVRKLAPVFVGSVALLALALLVPMAPATGAGSVPIDRPYAWDTVQDWLDDIEATEVVDPEDIERFRKALEELEQTPQEDWYAHAALEAGDHLMGQTERALQELRESLRQADQLLAAMSQDMASMPDGLRKQLEEKWLENLDGLGQAGLSLTPEMLQQLKSLQPGTLAEMDAAQVAQLREMLERGLEAADQCLGGTCAGGQGEAMGLMLVGTGTDGGGPEALTFKQDPSLTGAGRPERLEGLDETRLGLGELLGVSRMEPDEVAEAPHVVTDGSVAGPLQDRGGEVVWRQRLMPSEQEFLQQVFE